MILRRLGRVFVLALSMWGAPIAASAHSLPGSILTFADDDGLTLTVQFPLADLSTVAPTIADGFDGAITGPMSTTQSDAMGTYVRDHLVVIGSAGAIDLGLIDARFETGYNDHVGAFIWAVTSWSVPDRSSGAFQLRYDAVMHEIRNHRATVYWLDSDGHRGLADFGFRRINGRAAVVDIQLPK